MADRIVRPPFYLPAVALRQPRLVQFGRYCQPPTMSKISRSPIGFGTEAMGWLERI